MASDISVLKIRDVLLVTIPSDPDDATVSSLQEKVLHTMARSGAVGVVLDIAMAGVVDSFFARTIAETAQMVGLMGGRTVIAGMRAPVAITATQLGLTMRGAATALNVEHALDLLADAKTPRPDG